MKKIEAIIRPHLLDAGHPRRRLPPSNAGDVDHEGETLNLRGDLLRDCKSSDSERGCSGIRIISA